MKSKSGFLVIAIGASWMGCDRAPSPVPDSGNEALGVARFVIDESASVTSVVGLDSEGAELARLELVHGRFTLSELFADDYATPDVDGRKLTVDVLGQEVQWETAGYEPTLNLPAHPSRLWAVAAFLDDPHAKAVLDRWQIGFDPFDGTMDTDETAYTSGSWRGEAWQTCDGQSSCGTAYYGTINTCGGGGSAIKATRLTQLSGSNCGLYTSSYNQVLLSQCCPSGTGGKSYDWFAQKACPTTSSTATSCGTIGSGACKGCPAYPVDASYTCHIGNYLAGTCGGQNVYNSTYQYFASVCETCNYPYESCCEDSYCSTAPCN